ncbi:MAG TPA: IS1 family transposase [Candidatus Tectomicrobia bacterium]
MVVRAACPACGAGRFKRNGHIHMGQQNHQCKVCDRQFVLQADNRVIDEEHRTLVERLLCEKISLHGICHAVGVSIRWLMGFIVARCAVLPDHLHVLPVVAPREVVIERLEVETDEMWSFVKRKANKQWVWVAMDKQTRQIIAFHVGDRSHESAEQLWANLPAVYREQAMFYTDQYTVYTGIIPAVQHKAITKKARKTNHIERFNNTLRQRVSRLVRDTLAFSKKLANHSGLTATSECVGPRTDSWMVKACR